MTVTADARLALVELRHRDVILARTDAGLMGLVWVDSEGLIWPQAASTSNRVTALQAVTGRAMHDGAAAVMNRLVKRGK